MGSRRTKDGKTEMTKAGVAGPGTMGPGIAGGIAGTLACGGMKVTAFDVRAGQRHEQGRGGMRKTMSGSRLLLSAAFGLLAAIGVAAAAGVAEVASIALLVPEQGNEFCGNEQCVHAVRGVDEKSGLKFVPVEGIGYGGVRTTLRELAEDSASLMIAN